MGGTAMRAASKLTRQGTRGFEETRVGKTARMLDVCQLTMDGLAE